MTVNEAIQRAIALFDGGLQETSLRPRYPGLAVELTPRRITAVRVARDRKKSGYVLRETLTRDFPEGAIEPSLTGLNIREPEPVSATIREVLDKVGDGERRISLILPDHVARVKLLSFATLPRSRRELSDLVRFRMAKSMPFKAEDATLDLQVLSGVGAASGEGGEAIVLSIFVKRAILQQYEAVFTEAGYWPGLVGLSTIELFNLFRKQIEAAIPDGRDVLLLNVTPYYDSIVILKDGNLIFYRCKPHQGRAASDTVMVLRRELYTSLAFYQEKLLGRGIGRAFLRVDGQPFDAIHTVATSELLCEVERLDLKSVVSVADELGLDDEAAVLAAPAAGAAVGRNA